MIYDYSKLIGSIREKFKTQANFARALNISETSLNLRLNNHRDWSQSEMIKAMKLLDIDNKELKEYFFKKKV